MKLKRVASLALAACFALTPFAFGGCVPRSRVLKVYNWMDYIDEDLIAEFEDWYAEYTGKTIHVEYTNFDVNETMYPRISEARVDYDVTCPSDYMVYKMRSENLLQPIKKDLVLEAMREEGEPEPSLTDFNPFTFTERHDDGTPDYEGDLYSLGYMWGTVGIIYNNTKLTEEEVSTWKVLFDNAVSKTDLRNHVYMKDSVRESVSTAALYRYADELLPYYGQAGHQEKVREIINFQNGNLDTLLADYKDVLVKQHKTDKMLRGYETDLGKQDIIDPQKGVYCGVAWSGDAVWCMYELDEEEEIVGVRPELSFYIPHEGSNIWFDNWAIPKFANNPDAANLFIGFMSRKSSSIRNMDYIGYTSASNPAFEAYREEIEADEDLIFDLDGDGELSDAELAHKEMFLDTLFPSEATQARCAPYDDLGQVVTEKLDVMWRGIK